MEKITLKHVLPEVFATRNEIHSEIWHQNIVLNKGDVCLIEATSGTGKSSLCSYITGYRRDYQGIILFDDRNITQFSIKDWSRLRRESISILFQELRLFPELTAMENVQIKNALTKFKSKKEIAQWFERLGIADKMDAPIGLMSFGQQQRVAMIRALVQPFDFLLADEPVSHLDEQNSQLMAELMMEEVNRQGASVLVTSIGKHMNLNYDKVFKL